MADLTETEEHILIHALTGGNKDRFVYRNFYAYPAGIPTACDGLVENGFLVEFFPGVGPQFRCFYVTEAGAAAVGLHLPKD